MLHFSGLHLILVTKSVLSHFCFIAENQRIKRRRRVKQNKAAKGKLRTISRILICLNLIHHPAIYLRRQKARNRNMLITVCQGEHSPQRAVRSLEPCRGRTDTESHRAAVTCKKSSAGSSKQKKIQHCQ